DFTQSVAEHLDGPPRIAGVWADLQPFNPFVGPQGTVSYSQTPASFTVSYDDVPEFGFFGGVGSNTFDISLADNSFRCKLVCGDGDADSDSGTDTDLD
ncbi:MAG: hypothetical protein GTN89_08390, partial [Acidobacteria bacterium]|nr:hypothetical protein [Acidobacteriota bacterium]